MSNLRTALASLLHQSAPIKKQVVVRVIVVAAVLMCLGESSQAKAQQLQFGIDFTTVIPTGEFNRNVRNNGYGVSGNVLFGLGRSPFLLGVDAGVATYGSDERTEPISAIVPELRVKIRTNNNIVLTHMLFRAQPRTGNVRPYAEGLVGFKYLVTRTNVFSDFNDEELGSTKNLSDWTFSYGFGGGVQIRLARLGATGDISLDTKLRYLRGQRAEYLREGSIRRENGAVFFDVLSSRTDVLLAQIGVTFRF